MHKMQSFINYTIEKNEEIDHLKQGMWHYYVYMFIITV